MIFFTCIHRFVGHSMVTLAPQSSAILTNQIREGLLRRPLMYCLMEFGATPIRLAASPTVSPPFERSVSRSLAITRSSQTTGVRGEDERKAGIAAERGTTTGEEVSSEWSDGAWLMVGAPGDGGRVIIDSYARIVP